SPSALWKSVHLRANSFACSDWHRRATFRELGSKLRCGQSAYVFGQPDGTTIAQEANYASCFFAPDDIVPERKRVQGEPANVGAHIHNNSRFLPGKKIECQLRHVLVIVVSALSDGPAARIVTRRMQR